VGVGEDLWKILLQENERGDIVCRKSGAIKINNTKAIISFL